MNKQNIDSVSFDIIRYANCWEDADILLESLAAKPGSKILSIGSAGDNCFSLLTTSPSIVIAVDINPNQLHLIELKKVCFQFLTYDQILHFLGFRHCNKRLEIYSSIKNNLDFESKQFWDKNLNLIDKGVIHQGKFEKYFQTFSNKILPWIHGTAKINGLFENKSDSDQEHFYNEKWNSWRWKILFKIFFSKYILGKYGRDPQFLKEVDINVGEYIFNKAAKHLKSKYAQNNHMLNYALRGKFDPLLPHYLKFENHCLIKENIDKLVLYTGYAEDIPTIYGKMDAMNLSNIFEYMDLSTFKKCAESLIQNLKPGGKLAYWNLMVPRKISEHFPDILNYNELLSTELTNKDKGFFYNNFIVEELL